MSLAGTVAANFAPGSFPRAQLHHFDRRRRAQQFLRCSCHHPLCRQTFCASVSYPGNTAVLNIVAELVPEPIAADANAAN